MMGDMGNLYPVAAEKGTGEQLIAGQIDRFDGAELAEVHGRHRRQIVRPGDRCFLGGGHQAISPMTVPIS
ncbi:hypothetical protein D3C81_2257300 [compost metagenome]